MTTGRQFAKVLCAAGAACVALSGATAHSSVTAFFSAGSTCQGKPAAKFRVNGPPVDVTLCISATVEAICGHSVQLEAGTVPSRGAFQVAAHRMGPNYPDPTLEKLTAPIAITMPASPQDFGGTRDNPFPPAANQVLVLFTLRPPAKATEPAYTIRLGKNSLVSVGKNGSCLENAEVPISATLKLERE